ncbi:MAG: acyl-CoA dehydrogenase [Streptosporangiales bacterium]|nr:acyl-CoA dehydrogenase [Streptosporangiales bacterium]
MTVAEASDVSKLRAEVRELVEQWRRAGRIEPQCDAWLRGYDPEFSRALAERGWIGLTWPRHLGGSERSAVARLVLTEELLRTGAPVAGHWMGDRQIGPAILRYGTPELQRRYLPRIAAGHVTFCLGMSETESGSDLASVRTKATQVDGGWRITGRKIWTSHAHRATHAYVLARSDASGDKHEGLTEFIVDMTAAGVEVRPIYDLRGDHHFNEVTFDDVFVPDSEVLGRPGNGWTQVTEQLAFERGGMERVLSTYPLLLEVVAAADSDADVERVGDAFALVATLRRLGLRVADEIDRGAAPVLPAAVLKDVGTLFEQDVNELARTVLDVEPDPFGGGAAQLLAEGVLAAPGFTIRGGVTAILRTIVAREVRNGGRALTRPIGTPELAEVADDVLSERGGEPDTELAPGGVWATAVELGWPGVGCAEELGGSGGELADLVPLVQACGRHVVSMPLAESAWARLLAARYGHEVSGLPSTVVLPRQGTETLRVDGDTVTGTVQRVPWGCAAATLLAVATDTDDSRVLLEVAGDAGGVTRTPAANLAGEPRDTVHFEQAVATRIATLGADEEPLAVGALLRTAQTVGALQTALAHTAEHVAVREQFGRPLAKFQDVGAHLAGMFEQVTLAEVALESAVAADDGDRIAVAAVVAARAATTVTRSAHQLHGAIGITREHPLHLVTRRLWSWRDEVGGERYWARRIGRRVCDLGQDPLWDWVIGERT